ncbi:bacteriocin [Pseudoalteromonas sp. MMG013]|nr:bacteriocin [Pseudoalteromonas sp. MMG013]MBQ4863980.1 bacteriocin [Pseudoalteromonas sp. MMG013]
MKKNISLKVKKLNLKELKSVVGGDAKNAQYRAVAVEASEYNAVY